MHEHHARHMMRCRMMGMDPCMGFHGSHGSAHEGLTGCRHFPTREERIEFLERYGEWLEKESKGVQEAIEDLKNK